MARTPTEYVAHLMLEGGHREEVRFSTIQEFQKWFSNELMAKSDSKDFVTIPLKNVDSEYMVVRPAAILAIRVEPWFASSVDRY
uniref:Uncharacterized protein n=1 Tax=Cyanothece sp. (strain PCC 7425 / ATCC 29141) TaxID=395961 RepID=B8HWW8_CYAP4